MLPGIMTKCMKIRCIGVCVCVPGKTWSGGQWMILSMSCKSAGATVTLCARGDVRLEQRPVQTYRATLNS